MAIPVIMPRQGQSVESCIISKWHKKKGEMVQVGELLFSYETDKASFDEEARVEGMLLDIFFGEDEDVPCLTNICVIGEPGEPTDSFNPNVETEPIDKNMAQSPANEISIQNEASKQSEVPQAFTTMAFAPQDGKLKISPRAKKLSEKSRVDYRHAIPSGPDGRIIERDIIALIESGVLLTPSAMEAQMKGQYLSPVEGTGIGGRVTTEDIKTRNATHAMSQTLKEPIPSYHDVKLPNIRKVIAKAMHHSLSTAAQLTLNTSLDATDILALRKKLKENQERLGLENITLNDMILYAVARTLLLHPALNAHYLEDSIRYFTHVHLGVAIDTDRGLMVPTLFEANLKSLNDLSKEVKQLAKACQLGSIPPDQLQGGSFTVTNLGTLGIESFTPILNPPQTGILGVGCITQRVKEVAGEYAYYSAMGLSLTFDHRALDGAPAAKFLQDLKNNLEGFSVLLVK